MAGKVMKQKVKLTVEVHGLVAEAQRMAGIARFEDAAGALLHAWIKDETAEDLAQEILDNMGPYMMATLEEPEPELVFPKPDPKVKRVVDGAKPKPKLKAKPKGKPKGKAKAKPKAKPKGKKEGKKSSKSS